MSIYSFVPDPDALLALEPEELAGVLMQHLNELPPSEQRQLNRYNFGLGHTFREYPQVHAEAIGRAVMEAWSWLEREGLLAANPGSQGEWVFITRRGRQLTTQEDVRKCRRANLLPRQQLHPRIAQKWSPRP